MENMRNGGNDDMGKNIVNKELKINGMTCNGCETRIENKLMALTGVEKVGVSFKTGILRIRFDISQISLEQIIREIETLGYIVFNDVEQPKKAEQNSYSQLLMIGVIMFGGYLIIKNTIGFNFIPEVNVNMSYSILFIIGLLTSLHCLAMCGGINLSLCMSYDTKNLQENRYAKLKPSLLYNAGRVISYTILGGLVGALGAVFQMSNIGSAVISIAAGVFMVIMGLNMLNLFPWLRKLNPHMPKGLVKKINGLKKGKGPFIVGILNGFMPCGPLQAMQLYALGKASFVAGALSMFLFSLGTVPLMFTFGALGSMLSSKFTKKMIKVSAALVILLGVAMMNRGIAFTGTSFQTVFASSNNSEENTSVLKDDVQEIYSDLESRSYPEISVQEGIPVVWTIQADADNLNGCNNEIIIPQYNVKQKLVVGENVIQFTPTESGRFGYSCWMGMIRSSITVTPGEENLDNANPNVLYDPNSEIDNTGLPSGCCGI